MSPQFKFRLASVSTLAGLWLHGAVAFAAEPAQHPLSSQVSEPPTPNVMFTIDDSGSMLADFMPEGGFSLNGQTVNIGSNWMAGFPGDWRKLCKNANVSGCTVYGGPTGPYNDIDLNGGADQGFVTGYVRAIKGGEGIHQKHFRSPDVNKIFYNPDIRYLPWQKPDGTGRMAAANPTAARFDPISNSGTLDLTVDFTGATQINSRWFTTRSAVATGFSDFYPGLVYRLTPGANPNVTGNYTRYDINASDGSHAPNTKHPNRTDCAGTKCTRAEERQNFANWFTYYRSRELLTKAAISDSLAAFKDKLRVGWGRINKTNSEVLDGVSFKIIENELKGGPIRQFDATRMNKVLTGIQAIMSWPSTPLRTALDEVGRYFDVSQRGATGSPWLEDPTNVNSAKLSCRRSVSLLMTDGYYNDTYTNAGDVDGVDGPVYSGAENPGNYSPDHYIARRPYIDAPNALSNTLADVATKYFVKDLDTSIDNEVVPYSEDVAFWQHLTQFMVGLGVRGTLNSSTPADKANTLAQITAGTLNWPDPASSNGAKIDDMWHAAVNTGGDFYSVANVTELTEALLDAFGKAAGNEAKEAGVTTASPFTAADNVKYVPKYRSVSWYGDLEAYELSEDGEQESLKWKASDRVPAHADRNLFTWDAGSSTARPFKWGAGGMGVVNQGLVGSEALTNYIRGDNSQEGDGKPLRGRGGKVLGDFVNSPPVLVGSHTNRGYAAFDSSYMSYLADKRNNRSEPLVVVGGNGGMVHFFRGSDGTEVFGFLPRTGLANLDIIAAKNYGTAANFHRFFVDGPMTEADAKLSGTWTNLVLGAMGAGGKAFFAMKVPTAYGALDASDFTASTVMWEKSGDTDGDIGYMFSDFATGKIKGGGWKAFIGNGVYSANGDAVLLVVDLATGTIDKRLKVDDGGDTGLMGVTLMHDADTNEVVGAYAGDMKGNVWRFDFEGGAPGQWKIGFKDKPLFTATDPNGNRQPVTVPPVFVDHPESGRVVLFGTGKLIDESDAESTSAQSYYGVWDTTALGASAVGADSPFSTAPHRSLLQQQTIDQTPINDDGGTYYKVVSAEVDWEVEKGWFIDLPWSGQRVVYPSVILGGDYVYFSSIVPAGPAAMCEVSTGDGYNFLLRAADGGVLTDPIMDTDGDGDIDADDEVVQGRKTNADGRDAIVFDRGGGGGGGGQLGEPMESPCIGGWRYVWFHDSSGKPQKVRTPCEAGLKDRVWRQIVNPPTND